MSRVAICVEGLSKRYRIGQRERYLALRDVLTRSVAAPFRWLVGRRPASDGDSRAHIWALKDVSFQVGEGEVIGIIGRNGSGKSTLLKILARITQPTRGTAEVRGQVGSLLEVGTGFHPELTGRENIYLSGAILGMKKQEIDRKFDEIVSFAELERFVDTTVKYFSTGMQMRLAFAVAAHLEPEILLVDEVLAVGDAAFQKKCLGKMGDVSGGGRTVLFVSHQMNQMRRICRRCLWLDAGEVKRAGATADVVSAYEATFASLPEPADRPHGTARLPARFLRWHILEPAGDRPNVLTSFGEVTLRFVVEVNQPIQNGIHGIALFNSENQLVWATSINSLKLRPGLHQFTYKLPMLPLRPGIYNWQVSLWEDGSLFDLWNCVPEMLVATEPVTHPCDEWQGFLNLPWEFKEAEV